MSLPLLQTSPTVALEINTGRELEASVVPATVVYARFHIPGYPNSLVVTEDGLYAKRGRRINPFALQINNSQPLVFTTQLDQVLSWNLEVYDPDNLVSLATYPTRVTVPEAGRYSFRIWNNAFLSGGSAVNLAAQLMLIKNGSTWIAGQDAYGALAAGAVSLQADLQAYVSLDAGDYVEAYWRWLSFTTLTATTVIVGSAAWQGWRFAE